MNRILLLFAFFVFFVKDNVLFSQAKVNVDSLTAVLNQYPKDDTVKVKYLLGLYYAYRKKDPKKAIEYTEAAIKLSEQLQYDIWMSKSYSSKSVVLYLMGDFNGAKSYNQKATSVLEKTGKYPDELADCTMFLGSILLSNGESKDALKQYESALSMFETTQNVKKEVSTLVGIGNYYLNQGDYEKALATYQRGVKKNEKLGNKENLALLYSNIGGVYRSMGNYRNSLEYNLKSITTNESLGDLYTLAKDYNNMSGIYFNLDDKKEAQKYLQKALELHRKLNDKQGIALAMINISLTYDDNRKSIEELKQAMEYCKETNNKYLLSLTFKNLVSMFVKLNEYEVAYSYAMKGLDIEKEVKSKNNIIELEQNLAEILLYCSDKDLLSFGIEPKDRYKIAKEYLDKIFVLGKNINPKYQMESWHGLSIIQEKQQNYSEAYESYKKYIAIKDSISGDDVKKQITRKEIQYEFDKKETELKYQQQLTADELEKQRLLTFQQGQTLTLKEQALALSNKDLLLSNKEKDLAHLAYLKEQAEKQEKVQQLSLSEEREKGKEKDLTLKNLELSAQQKQNLYLSLLLVSLLAGLGTLAYFYTTLKKQKNIIAQQNELNEHTIAILSHDIKEPLLGVKLMLKKLNKDDVFVAQASQSLENQINSVNGILTNLLKMKKMAFAKKDKNASANVNTVVQNVIQELSVAIQTKDLQINNELTDDLKLPIAPEKLQIIVNNLLSNAVKYSFPNNTIRIFQEGKGFSIQDFGVGLSPEQRSKIMREVTASQQGTNQERGNGLGLFLVGAMLQGVQLKVVFDSPEVGGTIVKVLG